MNDLKAEILSLDQQRNLRRQSLIQINATTPRPAALFADAGGFFLKLPTDVLEKQLKKG